MYVLEACRRERVPYAVLASSSSVYGSVAELPKHEDLATSAGGARTPPRSWPPRPTLLAYSAAYSPLPALALRFFNVYGPLQPAGHAYAAVVPAFVDAALAGRTAAGHTATLGRPATSLYVGTVTRASADAVVRSGGNSDSPGEPGVRFADLAAGAHRPDVDAAGRTDQRPARSRPGRRRTRLAGPDEALSGPVPGRRAGRPRGGAEQRRRVDALARGPRAGLGSGRVGAALAVAACAWAVVRRQ